MALCVCVGTRRLSSVAFGKCCYCEFNAREPAAPIRDGFNYHYSTALPLRVAWFSSKMRLTGIVVVRLSGVERSSGTEQDESCTNRAPGSATADSAIFSVFMFPPLRCVTMSVIISCTPPSPSAIFWSFRSLVVGKQKNFTATA